MAISKAKRQKMEKLIYDVFSALDKTGDNTKKYRDLFKSMSDTQFDQYFKEFFANENEYLVLDVVDYERDVSLDSIEKAANVLGIPLEEYVIMPHINGDIDDPVITKFKVPTGYIHEKRVQQVLSKKNTTSTEIASRSALTGQVVGKDKNARDSDSENFALVTLGARDVLRELLGPRADDMVMKSEMYASIAQKGFVSLNALNDNLENKTTLNALDVNLICMGIKSDLVTDGYLVRKTLDSK